MNDKSTMRTKKFVVISIVLFLISKVIYDKFVFGCLPNMTYENSRIILWIMLLVSIAVVFGCVFRMRRTYRGIIASLLIPYGIYTVCVYWSTLHFNITLVLLAAAALSLFIGIFMMIRWIAAARKEQVSGHKLRSWFAATGTIFTAAMTVIIAPLLFQALSTYTIEEVYVYYSRIHEYLEGGMEKAGESSMDSSLEEYPVCAENEGMYLTDKEGNKVAGPYRRIFADDLKGYDHTCRYQDKNGLIGYLAADGTVLTPAIYIEASRFTEGKARVKESSGGMYYINNSFERISDDYMDGLDYESQGSFARVLLTNGKWGIINSYGDLVLCRADYIHPLPLFTQAGSAVIHGHACVFLLFFGTDDAMIIKEFEDFCAISEVFDDSFAIVENEEGMKAVVDIRGKIIVPPQYKSIEFLDLGSYPFFGDRDIIFTCTKENGTVHTMRKRW